MAHLGQSGDEESVAAGWLYQGGEAHYFGEVERLVRFEYFEPAPFVKRWQGGPVSMELTVKDEISRLARNVGPYPD
ncbi:hypothetical protein OEM_33060 [Mycobacterium intracellulare subsp. yongonense 05-1390]|nr:hypothetical protein OEM_33060 [Mycobacterium intracellulare subsp. yongonense 05-1390]